VHSALLVFIFLFSATLFGRANAQEILFWSNQATPAEEAQRLREQVLAGFGKPVSYSPQDPGPYTTRIQAEAQAGIGRISLIGGTHGDFVSFADTLVDLTGLVDELRSRSKIDPVLLKLGQLESGQQKYVPWMQAGYVMVASRHAMQYLPPGVDLNKLTYDQLIEWGEAMRRSSGEPKVGFPAGPNGLLHRFIQGFLYPSYTNSAVRQFRSAEAERMWEKFRVLWQTVNPASTGYEFMQDPLLSGEVWVAWDHVARIQKALDTHPQEFVVFAPPAGPAGRGFMLVVVGIGIPKTSPNMDDAKALLAHMLKPETQVAMLKATAFFPVVEVDLPVELPPGIQMTGSVLAAETQATDAVPSLLPVGLGGAGGRFNKAFTDAFKRIVLHGEYIPDVLDEEGAKIQALIAEAEAPCWLPDEPTTVPCRVN
jgi:multiple sugar transport system substrate-binding protein